VKSHGPPIRGQNSWQHLAHSLITFVSIFAIAKERVVAKVNFKSKWILAIVALFGVSLIATGVFASASITINTNNTVNLGAGRANVEACQDQATVETEQEYNTTTNIYELKAITIVNLDTRGCSGKTIKMALNYCETGGTVCDTQYAQWTGFQVGQTETLTWDDTANGTGNTSSITLDPVDTATQMVTATVAISLE